VVVCVLGLFDRFDMDVVSTGIDDSKDGYGSSRCRLEAEVLIGQVLSHGLGNVPGLRLPCERTSLVQVSGLVQEHTTLSTHNNMDASDVQDLVEDLTGNIDDLETSLSPLLNSALSASTSKLPLLDKAKLYILATYALDSVLFSYLRLNGADLKSHPVAQEIARVRTYFQKIKEAEMGPAQRSATLDKNAAARFIKHGLSGNEKYDAARAERIAAEKAGAKRKADGLEASAQWGSQNRFAAAAKRMRADEEMVTVVKANETDDEEGENAKLPSTSEAEMSKEERKAAKRQRRAERKLAKQSPAGSPAPSEHLKERPQEETTVAQAGIASSKIGPQSNHDTFQALLRGPLPKKEEKEKKKKRRSRKETMEELEDKRAREMM